MKYIITAPSSFPSAMKIRDFLQEFIGKKILVTSNINKIKMKDEIIFSYGLPVNNKFNSPDFIRLCSNKYNFSKLMRDNNFVSPVFYKKERPNKYPVLIRKTLCGCGGVGIVICRNENEFNKNWNDSYYWTPYYLTDFELRVHVFDGNIIKVFKKQRIEGNEDVLPIRNLDRGYHFVLVDSNKYPALQNLVVELNKIVHGMFYGLDVGFRTNEKDYIIFEANSACGLNDDTAKLYAEFILERL